MEKIEEHENKRRKKDSPSQNNNRPNFINKIQFKFKLDRKKKITVAICLFIITCIVVINNYTQLGLVLNKDIDNNDSVQVELQTSNNKLIPFGDQVLVYNKGKLTSYNSYGKNMGEIILEDTIESSVLTAGKYIQVVNKDKSIVYVYKNKYETARIKVDGKINSSNINSDGISVIEYSSNVGKTTLGIYDNSGNMKYNVKLNNKIIGKYELSDNARYLSYVDFDISGISVHTKINLIDLSNIGGSETNINTIHTIDNSLAYNIYWKGNSVIARFEEEYVLYNTLSEKKQVVKICDGQVINIGDYDKRYAYTEVDESGNYIINIRKMTSDSVKTIPIDDAPKYFKYQNGIVYVCYGKKIEAYNNFGVKLKKYDSDMVITEPVIFNDGRSLAMSISNKLIMFTI